MKKSIIHRLFQDEPDMLSGFSHIIELVKDHIPDGTIFDQGQDVLKMLIDILKEDDQQGMWNDWNKYSKNIDELLVGVFNIKMVESSNLPLAFSVNWSSLYTPDQWEVIRFFTSEVSNMSKEEWLQLTSCQLSCSLFESIKEARESRWPK